MCYNTTVPARVIQFVRWTEVDIMNMADDFILWIYIHTGDFDTVIFALPAIILTTLIYWVARRIWHKQKLGDGYAVIRRKARLNEIVRLLTVCWFCALFCIVIAPTGAWMDFWRRLAVGMNPFESFIPVHLGEIVPIPVILQYILDGHPDWLLEEAMAFLPHLLLNILLFGPLGFAMPFISRQTSFIKTILTGFSLSLIIEFIQFFLGRACEMDDLICNTLGAAAGYLLYLFFKKMFPDFTEKCMISVYHICKHNDDKGEEMLCLT